MCMVTDPAGHGEAVSWWLCFLLDQRADVAQAARALWIAEITGTLTGLDTSGDVGNDGATLDSRCPAHLADCVAKAVADPHARIMGRLLVDLLTKLVAREGVSVIRAKIHHKARLCRAEQIVMGGHVA